MKSPNNIIPLSGKLEKFRSFSTIIYQDNVTVFEINAKNGFTEKINLLQPSYNYNTIIENNQFVIKNNHYFIYDVSQLTDKIDFGKNKDFTIECICRMTETPNSWQVPFVNSNIWSDGTIMIQYNRSGYRFGLYWNGVKEGLFSENYYQNLFTDKTLYHIALVRAKDQIMTFVNGKLDTKTTSSTGNANFASKSGYLYIGYNAVDGGCFNGNISWLRISNVPRYTEDFNYQGIISKQCNETTNQHP